MVICSETNVATSQQDCKRSRTVPRRDGAWHCLRQAHRRPPFLKVPLCMPLGGLPYAPNPPTHTPVPGLHTLGEVLARRLLSASLAHTDMVILGSATALGLTGGHLKEALIIPNPLSPRHYQRCPRQSQFRKSGQCNSSDICSLAPWGNEKKVAVATRQVTSPVGSSEV